MPAIEIFRDYSDFIERKDKTINGVDEDFAIKHPDYSEMSYHNAGCWNCIDCYNCDYCSYCVDCISCDYCSYSKELIYCRYCVSCEGCIRCYGCNDIKNGNELKAINNKQYSKKSFNVPVVENIHQKLLEAVSKPGALNMEGWHSCATTHCRAGWIVVLASEKGKLLEDKTHTPIAALMIYKASSPIRVHPFRFYDNNEDAMKDIIRCAEEEKSLLNKVTKWFKLL